MKTYSDISPNTVISLKDFPFYSSIYYDFVDLCLPTECVISFPQVCVPKMARVNRRSFYFYNGFITTYEGMIDIAKTKYGKDLPTTWMEGYKRLFCLEVYQDYGDDGHIDFKLGGYVFIFQDIEEVEKHIQNRIYPVSFINDLMCNKHYQKE